MIRLLIVADDFTGALDTGVKLSAAGMKTKVMASFRESVYDNDTDVLVINTDSRHLQKDAARKIILSAAGYARAHGIEFVYKKTDSALRGNIGAELDGLMEGLGINVLPFIPAYPQIRRTTRHGIHYIDGIEVSKSVFGRDPFDPVRESSVADIIHSQSELKTRNLSASEKLEPVSEKTIFIYDSEDIHDLNRIKASLQDNREIKAAAGCAGFADLLPDLLKLGNPCSHTAADLPSGLLVICGSVNPITVRQIETAVDHGAAHYYLSEEEKLEPGFWQTDAGSECIRDILSKMHSNRSFIIDSNDPPGNVTAASGDADGAVSIETARRRTSNSVSESTRQQISGSIGEVARQQISSSIDESTRQRISSSIGELFAKIIDQVEDKTILITGGDTLLECMRHIHVSCMVPLKEIYPGVVLSKIQYNNRDLYIITKSGSFGSEHLFPDLEEKLVGGESI